MPVPTWLAQVNKRFFNPMEIRRGKRPVLVHTGRTSGQVYHTPLDAHPIDDGYIFVVNYGAAKSDWVKNTLVAGRATLRTAGLEISLTNPEILDEDEALELLPAGVEPPPKWMNVTEYLRMDEAG